MKPSWESDEAHKEACYAAIAAGKRPLSGPICRDCQRLIPREAEERYEVPTHLWCRCGHTTTYEADCEAHGVTPGWFSGVNIFDLAVGE